MAVRYFCDRCERETTADELRRAEIAVAPDPAISLDLCLDCAERVKADILGTAAKDEPQRPSRPVRRPRVEGWARSLRLSSALRGTGVRVAWGIVYLEIAVIFFIVAIWVTGR
jgi:hypothetical protein